MSNMKNQSSYRRSPYDSSYRLSHYNQWYIDNEWKSELQYLLLILGICLFFFIFSFYNLFILDSGSSFRVFLSTTLLISMGFFIILNILLLYNNTRFLDIVRKSTSRYFLITDDELVDIIEELIKSNKLPFQKNYQLKNIPRSFKPLFKNHTLYYNSQSKTFIFIEHQIQPLQQIFCKISVGPVEDNNHCYVSELTQIIDSCV